MKKIRSIMRRIAVAEAATLILGLHCPVGAYAEHDAKTSTQIIMCLRKMGRMIP